MLKLLQATVVMLLLVVVAGAGMARADATPARDAPRPELCTAAPPSFAAISQLMATPAAVASAVATGTAALGTPVAGAKADAVIAVVRELVACFNAGEPLRAYGLYSDAYLRHLLAIQGAPPAEQFGALATPEPLDPSTFVRILAIGIPRELGDGRIKANVTLQYAGVPVPKTFSFVFVDTASGWRIDALLGEINFSLP